MSTMGNLLRLPKPPPQPYQQGALKSVISPVRKRTLHTILLGAESKRTMPAQAASTSAPMNPIMEDESASTSGKDYFETDRRPIILFDGVCNLCNGGVNFMLDWDTSAVYRFAALQSTAGRHLLQLCGRAPDDISSVVVIEPPPDGRAGNPRAFLRSDAILRIGQRLAIPFPLLSTLGLPVPRFIRDRVYNLVADNRYSIAGRRNVCRLSDERAVDRFIS